MGGHKKQNVLKAIILCAGTALLVVCGLFYMSVRSEDSRIGKFEEEELRAAAEYVEADSNMAESGSTGKNKKAIKIVEVVPHPICSIFPYLVDWGTEKEYNDHLMIGYNGLQYLLTTNGNLRGDNNWITVDGTREQFDELADYSVEFLPNSAVPHASDWEHRWWRKYENTNINGVDGYFEYVGEGKGLYTIDLNTVVDKDNTSSYGIRYEMTAMNRKGIETPKGEYTVQTPVCFVADDYPAAGVNTNIKSWTAYNYELSFDCTSVSSRDYRIFNVTSKAGGISGLDYEYYAYWNPLASAEWTYGYEYQAKGNYQPKEVTGQRAGSLDEVYTGLYLRIESNTNRDKVANVPEGYFKQYDAVTDAGLIDADTTLYKITFEENPAGCYVLSDAGVLKEIEQDRLGSAPGEVYSKILFSYAGKGEGTYDVSFIYAPDSGGSAYAGTKYAATIEEVCFKAGRYALASEETDKEKLYVQGQGDYSKLVTSIDCRGIEYDRGSNGNTDSGTLPVGLCKGLTDTGQERGSWVFHAYAEGETPKFTRADHVKDAGIIYVYKQNRKKCYYEHNGFSNNEWFKLLIYLSDEAGTEPLAWQDYQARVLTGKQIKQKYRDALKEFDDTYKIEIVQRTPEELTVEDVEDAALLYFSKEIGVNGLSENIWNEIQSRYRNELPRFNAQTDLKYTTDISTDALFAIYRCCMYEQTTAIMFGYDAMQEHLNGSRATSNLGKMLMLLDLLDTPARFAEFIDGYEEKNPDYSTISQETGLVTVYKNNGVYNAGTKYLKWNNGGEWSDKAGTDIEPQVENTWDLQYFMVWELKEESWGIQPQYNSVSPVNGCNGSFPGAGNTYAGREVEDDWTWYTIHDLVSFVRNEHDKLINIWKILHNRKSKETSDPVILVTNADGSKMPELENMLPIYYFYVDAYSIAADSDFDIDFKINWTPEEITEPNNLISAVITDEGSSSEVYSVSDPQYKTDYTYNAVSHFVVGGDIDPAAAAKDFRITATDEEGKTDSVIVRFIIREAFNLN